MSETMARAGTDGTGGATEAAPPGRRPAWLTPVNAVITVATLLAFALRLYYQYSRPGFLIGVNEYDDGPYFGSAVLLTHGVIPYRDFIFVQPPGITLIMAPVGFLTTLTGTIVGLAVGRVFTMLAGAAAVVLGGLLVRHRGLLAVVVTCGVLAVYPDSVAAAHTVLVEPWLTLFSLIGAVAVFDGDRLTTSRRRLVWGGVAFGFAGAVEAWAIVPVIVVFALCLPQLRRAVTFAAGVAAGFLAPVVPFAALGPRQFYQSLITAQVGSRAHAQRVGVYNRLMNMLGLPQSQHWGHRTLLLAAGLLVAFVLVAYLAAPLVSRRWPPTLDWFAAATAGLVAAMFMWPPQFHYHFSAFLAPFLAVTVALSISRLLTAARRPHAQASPGQRLNRAAVGLAGLAVVGMAVVQARAESKAPKVIGPIPAAVQRVIPQGACVVTDQIALAVASNRLVSKVPGCPYVVDGLGSDLALSNGLNPSTGAGRSPAVAELWGNAFRHAQYVLLSWASDRRIPWTPTLTAYFRQNFTQVYQAGGRITIYARKM